MTNPPNLLTSLRLYHPPPLISDHLLSSIFILPGWEPRQKEHDVIECETLLAKVCDFVGSSECSITNSFESPPLLQSSLKAASLALSSSTSSPSKLFHYPHYAATLLATPHLGAPHLSSITCVVLDNWSASMVPSSSHPFQKLRSEPSLPPTMLEIGTLPTEELSNFHSHVDALIKYITMKDQKKKHGRHVKSGGFIQSVARVSILAITRPDLFSDIDLEVYKDNAYLMTLEGRVEMSTCGELTDVGRHTGHQMRDVAWYLALGSLYSILTLPSSSEDDMENTLSPEVAQLIASVIEVLVMIWLTDKEVERKFGGNMTGWTKSSSFRMKLETCSQMIESTTSRGGETGGDV